MKLEKVPSIRDYHSYTLPNVRTDVRVTKEGRLTSKAGQAGQTVQIPGQGHQGSDSGPRTTELQAYSRNAPSERNSGGREQGLGDEGLPSHPAARTDVSGGCPFIVIKSTIFFLYQSHHEAFTGPDLQTASTQK